MFSGIVDRIFKRLHNDEKIDCTLLADRLKGKVEDGTEGRIRRGFSFMTANDYHDLVRKAVYGLYTQLAGELYRMICQLCEAVQIYTASLGGVNFV